MFIGAAMRTNMRVKISKLRNFCAYAVIPAIISLALADRLLVDNYPAARIYREAPQPPAWLVWWHAISFIGLLIISLISIPRWQSFAGLLAWVFFLYVASKI
jgi:hypothetical protein